MSEDDRDIDVESADDVPDIGMEATASCQSPSLGLGDNPMVDKRAHHNALERRRRDHIKDSFHDLRDCIPSLQGEKVSRAHILNKATEYIRQLQKGGSIRESEIGELELKNEVLEEQVNALEQAKAQGCTQNAEDILQTVAEKVHARQKLEKQRKQAREQAQGKLEKLGEGDRDGGKAATEHLAGAGGKPHSAAAASGANSEKKTSGKGPVDGSGSQLLSNSLNLLSVASNLKNAQTLLSTLQKNLPANANLPANIKSLAARVLRAQGSTSVPRGIVTATTVPKGSPLTSNLAAALQQQQQLKQQHVNPSPRTVPSQLKPTPTSIPSSHTDHSSNSTSDQGSLASSSSQQSAPDSALPEGIAPPPTSSSAPIATLPSQSPQISPSLLAQATTLSSQLLAANSLLQHRNAAGGENSLSPTTAITPQISPELLTQVSSYLNIPNPAVSKASTQDGLNFSQVHSEVVSTTDSGEGLTQDASAESTLKNGGDTVSSESPALPQEGVKRPATDDDSNPSPKKPRMDQ